MTEKARASATALLLVSLAQFALAADRHPELTRLSPTEEIWLDARGRTLVVGGRVALADGPIELFACPQGTKEHESIVAVHASARIIHAGLLAIGLEPGSPAALDPSFVPPSGGRVDVRVRWTDGAGEPEEADARDWVREGPTGPRLEQRWVFAGGAFYTDPETGTKTLLGDGANLICVANFPDALLDVQVESAPANAALLFEAFAGRVPPRGTAVEIILARGD